MRMVQVFADKPRTANDECRRYMPLAITFDTSARLLTTVVEETWEPSIRKQWESNQASIREMVIHEFGASGYAQKIDDFGSLGASPFSVLALHNLFLKQVRSSFVAGAYYPALLGAAGLGERILNQLVLALRADYSAHPATQEVKTMKSISSWRMCIDALEGWQVMPQSTATKCRRLMNLRNSAVHYRKSLDGNDARTEALEAIGLLQEIIEEMFVPHNDGSSRFMQGITGNTFISPTAENEPMVKHFYLAVSVLVSPRYEMRVNNDGWFDVFDDADYHHEKPQLTDEQFALELGKR